MWRFYAILALFWPPVAEKILRPGVPGQKVKNHEDVSGVSAGASESEQMGYRAGVNNAAGGGLRLAERDRHIKTRQCGDIS